MRYVLKRPYEGHDLALEIVVIIMIAPGYTARHLPVYEMSVTVYLSCHLCKSVAKILLGHGDLDIKRGGT